VKYRKQQRGTCRGVAQRGNTLAYGEYGLQSLGRGWVTNTQLEACRVAINRFIKRRGRLWLRVFPHKPITKKPLETRMGKGKGNVEGWVAVVRPGTMLFEMDGIPEDLAREALRLAAFKLPVRSRFVSRRSMLVGGR
jgi:large subunit ribosomal protein L16